MAAIFDVLVRYDAASGKFVPQVAESLESNSDASLWALKLRSGIRFARRSIATNVSTTAKANPPKRRIAPKLAFPRGSMKGDPETTKPKCRVGASTVVHRDA